MDRLDFFDKGEVGPQINTEILARNAEIIKSEMMRLLIEESIGGNAGSAVVNGRKYLCAAANGYADKETGRIITFGNIQDLPEEITANNEKFTFRVALGGARDPKFMHIVDFYGGDNFSDTGRDILEKTIERFNSEQK